MTFGENVKRLIEQKEIPMAKICKKAGIDRSQFSKYVNGAHDLTLRNFIRIAKAYPNYVWDFDDVRIVITRKRNTEEN